jgi:hypothetical protein
VIGYLLVEGAERHFPAHLEIFSNLRATKGATEVVIRWGASASLKSRRHVSKNFLADLNEHIGDFTNCVDEGCKKKSSYGLACH